jgi:hypothetical protein
LKDIVDGRRLGFAHPITLLDADSAFFLYEMETNLILHHLGNRNRFLSLGFTMSYPIMSVGSALLGVQLFT